MIYAWDNYPARQFPGLWAWLAIQVKEKELVMASVAFEEVENKIPDCGNWLKDNELEQQQISNAILQDAMRIKGLLSIVDDNYSSGVGENDLLIITTARLYKAELVTEEARQFNTPLKLANYKIPAVCNMKDVNVSNLNFIEYIKRSGEVFR
jgi:hypothetical protein